MANFNTSKKPRSKFKYNSLKRQKNEEDITFRMLLEYSHEIMLYLRTFVEYLYLISTENVKHGARHKGLKYISA